MSPEIPDLCRQLSEYGRFHVFKNCVVYCFDCDLACAGCRRSVNKSAWFKRQVAGKEYQILDWLRNLSGVVEG